MRVKASTIIRACNDVEAEKRFAYRYRRAGYPPIEVIWDMPKTRENIKMVEDFIHDYYYGARIIRFFLLHQEKEGEKRGKVGGPASRVA